MTENYNNEVTVTAEEAVERLNGLAEEMTQGSTTTPEQPISVYEMPPTVSPFTETTTDDKPVSTAKLIIGGVGIAAAGYGAVKGVKWLLNKVKAAKAEKEEFRKWKEAQKQTVVEPHEVPETTEKLDEEVTE